MVSVGDEVKRDWARLASLLTDELMANLSKALIDNVSPDWRFSKRTTLDERFGVAHAVASAVAGDVAHLAASPSANDATSLRDLALVRAASIGPATSPRAELVLFVNGLHTLWEAATSATVDAQSSKSWELASAARYMADLCRTLLLEGTTELLLDDDCVGNGARQLARIEWNRELVDWMEGCSPLARIAPCLDSELRAWLERRPLGDDGAETAMVAQARSTIARIQHWLAVR